MLLIQKFKLFCAVLLIAAPGMASAQEKLTQNVMRPDDVQRLQGLNEAMGEVLRNAFALGEKGDLTILADALMGKPMSPEDSMAGISGRWYCRMIKLGGGIPIVVYPDFTCVITEQGKFEKISGSQRTKGKFYLDQDRLVYLGTGYIAGDAPPAYTELPAKISPQDYPQRMPEVGVVEMTGKDKGRILFPSPYLESQMNVLALRR